MDQSFHDVNTVSSRLNNSEFYLQILDNLENVAKCWEKVMAEISGRITSQMKRMDAMGQRVEHANGQLETLRGLSKKATVIQSSSRYPSHINSKIHCLHDELSSYARDLTSQQKGLFDDIKSESYELFKTFPPDADARQLRDTYQVRALRRQAGCNASSFLPRQKQKSYGLYGAVVPEHDALLAREMCANLQSVSSLVLFNSNRNILYRNPKRHDDFVTSNAANGVTTAHTRAARRAVVDLAGGSTHRDSLHGPPASFLRRDFVYDAIGNMNSEQTDALTYVPRMGDVPTLDMPETLLGLSNVADDVVPLDDDDYFGSATETPNEPFSLSPAVSAAAIKYKRTSRNISPMPPARNTTSRLSVGGAAKNTASVSHKRLSSVTGSASSPDIHITTPETAAPAAPLSALAGTDSVKKSLDVPKTGLGSGGNISGPPPPPPPPPPGALASSATASTAVEGDGRASLMQAIRGTGGFGKARLRPVSDLKAAKKQQREVAAQQKKSDSANNNNGKTGNAAPPQLDLLSELKKHLDLRRPAIAGSSTRTTTHSKSSLRNDDRPTNNEAPFAGVDAARQQLPNLFSANNARQTRESSVGLEGSDDASDDADWMD